MQASATNTDMADRPQPIPEGRSSQPFIILQRSPPKKTNTDVVQNQRCRTDDASSELEGSDVRTVWNSVEGHQGEKNQKGIKDKRGEKKKHVMQQQHLGSHRPNPKPSRKANPIITQGPFSR